MSTNGGPSPETAVLVAGAGPVGLATAFELGTRGVECLVVEPRREVRWDRPRAKTTSARTMEHLRRWGIADAVRAAAPLPLDYSDEVVFCTGLLGREITRFRECFALAPVPDERLAEAGQQIPQPRFEEVLREALGALPSVRLLLGWRVAEVEERAAQVVVHLICDDGRADAVEASFVVGCDGPRSVVREAIGATYEGTTDLRPNLNLVFRAKGLHERHELGPAIHYWVLNPRVAGVLGPMDTDSTWWVIASGEGVDQRDPIEVIAELVGDEVEAEVVSTDPWTARMALVSTYGKRRIFLAGDAAHLNPPWGGHGFNTGVGDAVNIGWKLAAVLGGWGGAELLASYEAERRPIAAETIALAERNMRVLAVDLADPALEGEGQEAEEARRAAAEVVQAAKEVEFHSLGLVLGYSYAGSPIVADGPAGDPHRDPRRYEPAAAPGWRLPHFFLPDGRPLYDLLGSGLSLLVVDGGSSEAFEAAAAARSLPLTVVHLDVDPTGVFAARYLLVRPDQHIAWRGDEGDHNPGAILDRARGASPGTDLS